MAVSAHRSDAAPRSWKFTLLQLFILMTLLCVAVRLLMWHLHLGIIGSVAMFGAWSTVVRVSLGYFRRAYFQVAFLSGIIWYLAAQLPITPVAELVDRSFPNAIVAMYFCLANLVAAAALWLWRSHGLLDARWSELWLLAFSCIVFVALANFGLLFGFKGVSRWYLPELSVWGIVFALLAVFFSLTVALPASALTVSALQWVIQCELDVRRHEGEVLLAVERLQQRGLRSIFLHDVAGQAVLDAQTTARHLTLLRQSGQLQWTSYGYRIAKRPRA